MEPEQNSLSEQQRAETEALDWFARLRSAPDDPALRAEFAQWHATSARNAAEFDALREMWASTEFEGALKRMPEAAGQARRAMPWRRWALGFAAGLAVLAVIGWMAPEIALRWQADYLTGTGEQMQAALPDGSRIVLNTASAVALDFENGNRHVDILRGEAYFDVVHDAEHPFTVSGAFGMATVLGTSFSFLRDSGSDAVVLEEGRVMLEQLSGSGSSRIDAGQLATVSSSAAGEPVPIDAGRALAWREGRLHIEDMSLSGALKQLQRYHGGAIVLANNAFGDMRVSGDYRIDDTTTAVRTLADVAGLSVLELPGGNLVLY